METIREVNPARLAWGTYDHGKNDYVSEGDIPASYSADCIAMGQPVRKPFRMDGETWVTIALCNHGARAYRLCPLRIFNGTPTNYRDKTGSAKLADAARNDPNGFYDRMTVRQGGLEFVLCGPEVQIVAGKQQDVPAPQVQLALFDHYQPAHGNTETPMLGRRLNPTIHRYEDVELIEVHSEYLECSFLVAKDDWESGKTLLNIYSPLDGNVLGFPHYRLHRDNISATGPKLPDGTTAQPGMAEAIEIQLQAGHALYADHLSAMLYGTGPNPARS